MKRSKTRAEVIFRYELFVAVLAIVAVGYLLGYWAAQARAVEVVEVVEVVEEEPQELTLNAVEPVEEDAQEPVEVEAIELTLNAVEPEPEPVPEPVAAEPVPSYTEEDLETLALIIYQEAGADYCSDSTRLMVGNVVLNRVADDRFPDTITEVATQRAQYGRLYWTGLVWPKRAAYDCEAHAVERAYNIARRLLEGERVLPDDVIYQAEFPQGTEIVAQSPGFYFCR